MSIREDSISEKIIDEEVVDEEITNEEVMDELVEEGDLNAIRIRGYAAYGDKHPLYECDWNLAKDCMLILVEKGDDFTQAVSANTLGYIYYYGRCNNFVPEYEKAYQYFSLAAFYGLHEATYKVGDMLAKGLGTFRNKTAAFQCYWTVYKDCYMKFQVGNKHHVLSDAALRMGRVYLEGIGAAQDLHQAHYYLLQADCAMRVRMKHEDFYGIEKVKQNIEEALNETRELLVSAGQTFDKESYRIDPKPLIEQLAYGNHILKLSVSETEDSIAFTFIRTHEDRYDPAKKVMLTVEKADYCEMTDRFTLRAKKETQYHLKNDAHEITFNQIYWEDGFLCLEQGRKRMGRIEYVEMKFGSRE